MKNEKENPLLQIISISKQSDFAEIEKKLLDIKMRLDNSANNLLKKALIDYFRILNPLSSQWKESEIISFSNKIANFYHENNICELLKKSIEMIKEPLLKYLIEIDEYFPKEKENAKCCCLKIILLTQYNGIICDYINQLFAVDELIEFNDIKKDIMNLNLKNPYSIFYLHELIKNLVYRKDNKEKILDIVSGNIKNIQIFRCKKCFDILFIIHNSNGTSLLCNNQLHSITNSETLKTLNQYELKCFECRKIIKIYYDNYKCIECKNFVCKSCIEKHTSACILSNFIYLYEVGFTCEKHNKKYIDSCDLCNKNLCENCKSNHYHIIKPESHIIFEEDIQKLVNYNKLYKVKNYIKYHLYQKLKYMKQFNFTNQKVPKSLFLMIYGKNLIFDLNLFSSKNFFDEEFKEYYKDIIEEAKSGKIEAYENLRIIENNYKKMKKIKKEDDNGYREFLDSCFVNQIKRGDELNDIYSLLFNRLLSIQSEFDKCEKIEIKKDLKEIEMDNILIKSKIIGIINSNQIGKDFMKKLLGRYLADFIIRIIFKKYSSEFKVINISLSNIYEIIINYGKELIDDKKINLINELAGKLIFNKEHIPKEDYEKTIISYINSIKTENKIAFQNSISINEEIIEKNDLNFTLASLLYLRNIGNITAHPNIESKTPIKINDVSIQLKKIRDLLGLDSNISNNSLIDKELIEDVKTSLHKIKDEMLKDFQESLFKSNSKIEDILFYLFKDNWERIINKNDVFLRALTIKINEKINNLIEFQNDYVKNNDKLKEFQKIIKQIEEKSERLSRNLNEYKNFNLGEYKGLNNNIKKEIENIYILEFDSLQALVDEKKKILKNNLSNAEKKVCLIYIIVKEYLNSERFKLQRENAFKQLKELVKLEIIKKKLQKILDLIEKEFGNSKSRFDDNLFIGEVRTFIKKQKFDDYNTLYKLSFDSQKLIDIIIKLVGNENFEWLSLPEKETTSLLSYLYYLQNKSK